VIPVLTNLAVATPTSSLDALTLLQCGASN
jgi:hypothetical protein